MGVRLGIRAFQGQAVRVGNVLALMNRRAVQEFAGALSDHPVGGWERDKLVAALHYLYRVSPAIGTTENVADRPGGMGAVIEEAVGDLTRMGLLRRAPVPDLTLGPDRSTLREKYWPQQDRIGRWVVAAVLRLEPDE